MEENPGNRNYPLKRKYGKKRRDTAAQRWRTAASYVARKWASLSVCPTSLDRDATTASTSTSLAPDMFKFTALSSNVSDGPTWHVISSIASSCPAKNRRSPKRSVVSGPGA